MKMYTILAFIVAVALTVIFPNQATAQEMFCKDKEVCKTLDLNEAACNVTDIRDMCCESCGGCDDNSICNEYTPINLFCQISNEIRKHCPKSCGVCKIKSARLINIAVTTELATTDSPNFMTAQEEADVKWKRGDVPYTCGENACKVSNYIENIDWAYYSQTNGNCSDCMSRCNEYSNCGSIECGGAYCMFWKKGKCSNTKEFNLKLYTCRKTPCVSDSDCKPNQYCSKGDCKESHEILRNIGELKTPNYPEDYPSRLDDVVVVTFNDTQRIELKFLNFRTEYVFDWLEVRDGASRYAPLIGKRMSGSILPSPVVSSGNSLFLMFHSDNGTQYSGYRISVGTGFSCGKGELVSNCSLCPRSTEIELNSWCNADCYFDDLDDLCKEKEDYTAVGHAYCLPLSWGFNDLKSAKDECSLNSKCNGVIDETCSHEYYYTCHSLKLDSKSKSCGHKKKEYYVVQHEFIRSPKGVFCDVNRGDVIKEFKFSNETLQDASSALLKCEKYCSRNDNCQTCSIHCNESCRFNALASCADIRRWDGFLNGDISQKPVCLDINIATGFEGLFKEWTFGPCSSTQKYEDFHHYIERCCVNPGWYTLTCFNTGAPEGWKRGYIELSGHRYCEDFMSFKAMHRIQIKGVSKTSDANKNETSIEYNVTNKTEKMYIKADLGYECSLETLVSTESECLIAANEIGYEYRYSLTRENRPIGCYWYEGASNKVFFNIILDPSITSVEGNRGGLCKVSHHLPLDGCPPDTVSCNTQGCPLTCFCEHHCSYERCNLFNPPENCLYGTSGQWVWNNNYWKASFQENTTAVRIPSNATIMKMPEDGHVRRMAEKRVLKKVKDIQSWEHATTNAFFIAYVIAILAYCFRSPKMIRENPKILFKRFEKTFTAWCCLGATFMTIKQLTDFLQNRDSSSIEYVPFNLEGKDKYPSYSLCLKGSHIYWENENAMFDKHGITSLQYVQFLKGSGTRYIYDEASRLYRKEPFDINSTKKIDFPTDILHPSNIIHGVDFVAEPNYLNIQYGTGKESVGLRNLPFGIGHQNADTICYSRISYDKPDQKRMYDLLSLKRSLFTNGSHSSNEFREFELSITFHHPGHLLRSIDQPSFRSNLLGYNKDKRLDLHLSHITTLRKRPNSNIRCQEAVKNDDDNARRAIIELIGCIPIYWKNLVSSYKIFQVCTSQEQLRNAAFYGANLYYIFSRYDPPCEDMKKLVTITKEIDQLENELQIKVIYTDDFYEEIKSLREISFLTFFSSVGGFIGIFVGYSFLQIPGILTIILSALQKRKGSTMISIFFLKLLERVKPKRRNEIPSNRKSSSVDRSNSDKKLQWASRVHVHENDDSEGHKKDDLSQSVNITGEDFPNLVIHTNFFESKSKLEKEMYQRPAAPSSIQDEVRPKFMTNVESQLLHIKGAITKQAEDSKEYIEKIQTLDEDISECKKEILNFKRHTRHIYGKYENHIKGTQRHMSKY